MKTIFGSLAGAVALFVGAGVAQAACTTDVALDDMTYEDAQAVYECLADDLHAGYQKGSKRWIPAEFVSDYRSWTKVSTLPANPGFHSERFLLTWVNDVGVDAYTEFKDEDAQMPAGTLIAKESFSIRNGKAVPGPLFIMQKVAAGTSPQTNDWYYMMVAANGRPQAVNVMTACNECHSQFSGQDFLGYPVEEVRLAR